MGEYEHKAGEDKMNMDDAPVEMTIAPPAEAVGADLVMIYKGDLRITGSLDKMSVVRIVGRFLERTVPGIELFEGDSIIALAVPKYDGDADWMLKNVFKKLYMVGLQGDKALNKMVDRAVELYEEAPDHEGKAGFGILKYYLDRQLMKYDIWRG